MDCEHDWKESRMYLMREVNDVRQEGDYAVCYGVKQTRGPFVQHCAKCGLLRIEISKEESPA